MGERAERSLLRQARSGGPAAFARLQEELVPTVRRFIWRLIGQNEDEDEIVQDVFLALYMNLERIDPVENLRPFLFRVVRNRCYNELRRQGRYKLVSLDGLARSTSAAGSFAVDRSPLPDEVVQWHLLFEEVRATLERLPEVQRQTVILYAEENFTYTQIAQAMNTNLGTVKSRLHHARRTLRRLVRPESLALLGIADEEEAAT